MSTDTNDSVPTKRTPDAKISLALIDQAREMERFAGEWRSREQWDKNELTYSYVASMCSRRAKELRELSLEYKPK